LNRFPKAFGQFIRDVNVGDIATLGQLEAEFAEWAGRHWTGSYLQRTALANEARKLGILDRFISPRPAFSTAYGTYQSWSSSGYVRTTPYSRRIASYMRRHPHASLKEARGHSKK
jgi:hypothetical protein